MEPDGQPLTPGTSNGPLSYSSAPNPITPNFLSCSLESSCSPNLSDGLMTAECTWDLAGEDNSEQTAADPQRNAQRRLKSSAFPSSLSWDSDSEKETLDEEELQNFSNPHGLATHSPGSPSAGLRLDGEDDQEFEKLHSFNNTTDTSTPAEGCSDNKKSTKKEEPNTSQLGQTESADNRVWSVCEGAKPFLSKGKPKEDCPKEEDADGGKGETRPKGQEAREPERDVYTFPGDSDAESPPPAPWAHCTFIQRCRRKRALLRPFSGIGSPETHKLEILSPQTSKTDETAPLSRAAGVYEFEEVNFDETETIKFRDKAGKELEEKSGLGSDNEIFTCVECSIYFKKQVHLQEHMTEHCQTSAGETRRSGKGSRLRCAECGWNLPNRPALADHHRRHQESRLKIQEEIEKLNENDKAKESEALGSRAVKHACADPIVTQYTDPMLNPGEMSDREMEKSPALSTASFSVQDTDPVVIDVHSVPPNSNTFRSSAQAHRRRFVCSECNFSTRTSQALANHSKIHKRKKHFLHPHPGQRGLREHQTLVHPEKMSTKQDNETSQSLTSKAQILKIAPDCHYLSECESLPNASPVTSQGDITASEDSTKSDRGAMRPESVAGRFRTAGKPRADQSQFDPEADDDTSPGSEAEESESDLSNELKLSQREASSPVGRKLHNTEESSPQQEATLSPITKKCAKDQDEQEVQKDRRVFFLRRSSRVTAAQARADSDDDDDDTDEEHVPCFLSKGAFEEDVDETDEDSEVLRSVERKCPYCPDRFHNGIGLANHVRGHLKRVGVSYNVRHFISPEEVNAIEKRFSYQKKKKKVANFDPDTFSLMHCEFCSAGFDTRAGLSSHARAHLRDFGITNWDVTISPIHILRELFSSRPDLVIPTDPPRSLCSSSEEDQDEDCDEGASKVGGIIRVKLEGETSEKTPHPSDSVALCSGYQRRKKEERVEDYEGDDKESADEEDEEGLRLSALDGLCSSTGRRDSLSLREDVDTKVRKWKCEVCDSQFESRRGLSIHSRAHLRQLGFTVSESGGSAIDLLHQIAMERSIDGKISSSLLTPKKPSLPVSLKDEEIEDMELEEKPIPLSIRAKAVKAVPSGSTTSTPSPGASPAPAHSNSPSSVVKKAPISSLLPVSSPLRSPEHKVGGMKCLSSNLSAASATTTSKPLWAPQENDAPLNLTLDVDSDKDIVCQLCGAWFETRKGLSSHARAHLRHFGIEYSESKGSPIELLSQLMDTDDFKHKASALELDCPTETQDISPALPPVKQSLLTLSSSSSGSLLYKVTTVGGGSKVTSTSASSLPGPPAKRLKTSSMQVFRLSSGELMALPHNEPPKEIGCEYCGEYFENRKGLSSHARSHLRQMGITEWSVNGSPIDTLREIITRRGLPCALPLKPLKTPPSSSPGPPRSPLSASSSPSATVLGRLPFAFARPSSPPQSVMSKASSASSMSSSCLSLKPKPEPVQVEVTSPGSVGRSGGFPVESPNSNWSNSDKVYPLNLAMAHEVEPTRDIRCEFCGEYFENRKGLSSHARSHLRQMGITEWSVNGSPIDTLREVMHKRGSGASSRSDQGVKKESSQGTKSPLWENVGGARGSEGKLFRLSPLGKRPSSDQAQSTETAASQAHRLKTFPSLPHDFSYKRKPSPEKHGHQDPSCELCGFYFENRKALASHARAHLRQFGVTEWSVNGSPIETLSAWIRNRPQKVLEMHRNYMQGNRSTQKKKRSSSITSSVDSDHILPISSQKAHSSSSSSQWSSSLAASLTQPRSQELRRGSSEITDDESGTAPVRASGSSPTFLRLGSSLQAQVARSELNVRLPRGFERRPLKHPSCPDGSDRDSGSPKPPRRGTLPSLVPKPPSYPLVKLVGKFYTLKCRFCEVEFHGPLSVQEDWIRHLQQHIFKMNYNKSAPLKAAATDTRNLADNSTPVQDSDPASNHSSRTASTPTRSTAPNSRSPTPVAEFAPAITAKEITQVSEEQPAIIPTPIPLSTQIV
ncbi:protein Wiz-like isoform X4 [Girardinichthys multiradiatus]|uniref:protein Wiz-like isoform X4 n=1 Tax=Girardinichthys multiradiatus TaxID=208333 RepID=UPI001FACBB0F|nr:protein Wiz-like isoform X4 [Girardinichthys multiradiatus]